MASHKEPHERLNVKFAKGCDWSFVILKLVYIKLYRAVHGWSYVLQWNEHTDNRISFDVAMECIPQQYDLHEATMEQIKLNNLCLHEIAAKQELHRICLHEVTSERIQCIPSP
ncbi:hypothetical protein V6N13_114301 [Hibiscus sabdariffa]